LKKIAIFLTVLTGLALALVGYQLYASALRLEVTRVDIASASERADAFGGLLTAARRGDLEHSLYRADIPDDPAQCALVTITLNLRNHGLLPAEWIDVEVEPMPGDYLRVPNASIDLRPLRFTDLSIVLVSSPDGAGEPRPLHITYYVLGRPMRVSLVTPRS